MPNKLSSTESALLHRELYCDNFMAGLPGDGAIVGGALRPGYESEPVVDDAIATLISEYRTYEIYENLYLTFQEYLDTPYVIREAYIKYLADVPERRAKELAKLKEELGNVEKP